MFASAMSNSFANHDQEPNFFQRPPRALQYEEAENHPDPDPGHTPEVKSFPRFQRPEQFISTVSIAGPSSQWYFLPVGLANTLRIPFGHLCSSYDLSRRTSVPDVPECAFQ